MTLRERLEAAARFVEQQQSARVGLLLSLQSSGVVVRVSGPKSSYHREVTYDQLESASDRDNPLLLEIKEGLRQVT